MKIALITGGNRGIGRAIALSTAAKGQDILLTYRSHQEEAEEVIALIEKRGRKAVAYDSQAGFELIGVPVLLPRSVQPLQLQALKVSQLSRLI